MEKKYVDQVFDTFTENPQKLNEMLKGDDRQVIRGILKDTDITDQEIDEVTKEVEQNAVMRLYQGAGGGIDAGQLMDMTGGFTPERAKGKGSGIAALLDGKFDINDILALASLMGAGSSQQQTQNTSSSLLGSLFGMGGSSQPQPQAQQNSMNSLLSALLGGGQPQVQQQPQNTQSSLFSALFGTPQQTQQVQQPQTQAVDINALLSQLMAQQNAQPQQTQQTQQVQQTQTGGLNSLLGSLLSGGTASSGSQMFTESSTPPSPQVTTNSTTFNNLLNGTAQATNSNGTVNLNSLFGVLNDLMGKK